VDGERRADPSDPADRRARDGSEPVGREDAGQPLVFLTGKPLDDRERRPDPEAARADPLDEPGGEVDAEALAEDEAEVADDHESERDEQHREGMPSLQDASGERVPGHLADGERGDQRAHEPRSGAGRIPDLGDDGRNDAVARGVERREREQDGEGQLVLRPVMVSRFWRANGADRPGRRKRQYG